MDSEQAKAIIDKLDAMQKELDTLKAAKNKSPKPAAPDQVIDIGGDAMSEDGARVVITVRDRWSVGVRRTLLDAIMIYHGLTRWTSIHTRGPITRTESPLMTTWTM